MTGSEPESPLQPQREERVIAQIREVHTPEGRVWRVESTSEGFADHAWLERERLLQLSEGAQAVQICWSDASGEEIQVSYCPQLPQPDPALADAAA